MKKLLFILSICIFCGSVSAQRWSFSTVEQVTGDGITYELEKTPMTYFYHNIENYRGNGPYVNLDGTPAAGTWEDYDAGKLDVAALRRVIQEVFTPQELADFKATDTSMRLSLVFDNQGAVIEVYFNFNATTPVKSLSVERIAQLEKRLKAEVTTHITDPATKKIRFVVAGFGYNFKYMDEK